MRYIRKIFFPTLVVMTMLQLMLILPAVQAGDAGSSEPLPASDVTGSAGQAYGVVKEPMGAGSIDAQAVISAVSVPSVIAGRDGQAGRDFTIPETAAGAFAKDGYIILDLPDNIWFAAIPTVEVTAGDLRVGSIRSAEEDNQVLFKIETESTVPSTITVTGVSLRIDRSAPEGDITLKIMGSAAVKTNSFGDWANSDYAAGLAIAKVVTPAPNETRHTTVFQVGSTEYTVNGVQMVMDTAPFIDAEGRTMLPLRFAANAAGISDYNILWHEAEQSVTLISGNRIVRMFAGRQTVTVNGVSFEMDTVPIIADPGRLMLPIRYAAQALGCTVAWDAAARTVTVTQTDTI